MLDQLEMVLRRYEQITSSTYGQADQFSGWLEFQVGGIVSSLLARPGFRHRVRWPIERLCGEADCPERNAVLAADDALVDYANSLSAIARVEAIRRQLLRMGDLGQEVDENDPSALDPVPEVGGCPATPLGLTNVEFVASRPWKDLVSAADYFHPVSEYNLKERGNLPWGQFMPYVTPTLQAPGDFVSRCLELRVRSLKRDLRKFWVRCDTAHKRSAVSLGESWGDLCKLQAEFERRFEAVREFCFKGEEAKLRDSCIALFQIYVAFHHDADMGWLGPVASLASNACGFATQATRSEVAERAASALVDIKNIVRRPQPPEDVIEEAKSTKRLVLVEEQRKGFFDGVSIDRDAKANWHSSDLLWELLWTLADRARLGKSVDQYCLSNRKASEPREPPSSHAVKDRRSDLKKLIVDELNDLILDAGRSTYYLVLKPEEICLLGWSVEEQLVELEPSPPWIY